MTGATTEPPSQPPPEGTGPFPPPPDDLSTALAKALAEVDLPPRIVTFSRGPTEDLMRQVFGPDGAAARLWPPSSATGEDPEDLDPARLAVAARFLDPAILERVARRHAAWLDRAGAVMIRFLAERLEGWDPAAAGLTLARTFTGQGGRPVTLFTRPRPASLAAPAPAETARPPLRRLVIVDPCLGTARGHFLPYALRLAEGARAVGVETVWASHRDLPAGVAPPGVEVRRCFARSYVDFSAEAAQQTDLSPELAAAWLDLLDTLDGPDTHFLVHTTDAHLLRAAAAVSAARPDMASVIHLVWHNSPRRVTGRAAGEEAHRVLLRLRRSPAFGRQVLLWSETARLGRWMGEWLEARVPAPPHIAPAGLGGGPEPASGRNSGPGAKLRLAVLGESRPSKGFLDLAGLMDALAARPGLAGGLHVAIQYWPGLRGAGDAYLATLARLSRHAFVEIVEGELSGAAYEVQLAGADALLLPYRPESYGLRSSGILVEALTRGIVVVVRAGCALEDAAGEGVVRRYETPEDFADAVEALAGGRGAALAEAASRAAAFRAANTPAAYVSALDRRARGT